MKIYQLHKHSGQYEDYHDYIIGSYVREERARAEKIKAEVNEKKLREHSKRCEDCPFLEEDFSNLDDLLAKYPNYCDKAQLSNSADGIDCAEFYMHFEEAYFEIEEIEVEE